VLVTAAADGFFKLWRDTPRAKAPLTAYQIRQQQQQQGKATPNVQPSSAWQCASVSTTLCVEEALSSVRFSLKFTGWILSRLPRARCRVQRRRLAPCGRLRPGPELRLKLERALEFVFLTAHGELVSCSGCNSLGARDIDAASHAVPPTTLAARSVSPNHFGCLLLT